MALSVRSSPAGNPGATPQGQEPDGMVGTLRDGIAMVASFSNRGKRFYKALAEIAHLLPEEGDKAKEGMRIVTDQRKWMMMVFGEVGAFVGKFYTLEKNFLYEMRTFWETGSQAAPISLLQKNAVATMTNLADFRGRLDDCLQMVATLEASATALKQFKGEQMTLQDACMEQLATFGGSREIEARLEDQERAMRKVTQTQKEVFRAAAALREVEGRIPELSAKYAILDSIAHNEKRSMTQMIGSAKALEETAKKKAEEAGHAMNQHYTRKVCGFTVYEYEDNEGDAERERARKLREYAKEAQRDTDAQQEKVKKAAAEAAEIQGLITQAGGEKGLLSKYLAEAEDAYSRAKAELQVVERKDKEARKRFGGMSLRHIAELRHHMQEFPGLLAPQNAEDRAMFTTMKGHLESHKAVMKRMQIFLDCKSSQEALDALQAVRPTIRNAIEQAAFYNGALGGLKGKIETDMATLSYARALPNETAARAIAPAAASPADGGRSAGALEEEPDEEPVVSLNDDDDEPW